MGRHRQVRAARAAERPCVVRRRGCGFDERDSLLMPPPPLSWLSTISAYVGLVARSSSCVPRADDLAVVEHQNLVGVDDGGDALRDHDAGRLACTRLVRAARSRASVRRVERRERVVEHQDLRLLDECPRDREPLSLAAGEVRAALRDRCLELSGSLLDEVPGLGDVERLPQVVVGRIRVPVAQVGRDSAGEEVGRSAARGRCGSTSRSGSRSRTSTPSTSTSPSVASKRRGSRLTSVVLPAPVLPMMAVVVPAVAVKSRFVSTGASAPG